MLDEIILGHNQFFGVNHLASQTGNQKAAYFSDVSRIMEIIEFCYDQGVHGLMMSTHERAVYVTEEILKNQQRLDKLGVYLLVPYVAKCAVRSMTSASRALPCLARCECPRKA